MPDIRMWLKEHQERWEIILNTLSFVDGVLILVKQISWRILSFFIAYLALIGLTVLENQNLSVLEKLISNTDVFKEIFMISTLILSVMVSIKIFSTQSYPECVGSIAMLLLSTGFVQIVGYSRENLVASAVIYVSIAVLEWICDKAILIIVKIIGRTERLHGGMAVCVPYKQKTEESRKENESTG